MVKISSRKEIIRRAVRDKALDFDEYKLKKKTGYWKTFLTSETFS